MNKRLLNNLLYGALLLSVGTSVFSCKDYDDDIAGLDNRISTVESDMERFKEKIQAALDANLTVASWYPSDDFSQYTIVLSNGDELRLQVRTVHSFLSVQNRRRCVEIQQRQRCRLVQCKDTRYRTGHSRNRQRHILL